MNNIQSLSKNEFDAIKTEYIILRKEMQSLFNRQHKIEITMFSVYSLILAYLLSQPASNPLSFLVPIPLVIIFYKIKYDIFINIWSQASYCIIFFADYNFVWEERLRRLRNIDIDDNKLSSHIMKLGVTDWIYFILCIICMILFLINAYKGNYFVESLIFSIISSIILFLFFLFRPCLGMPHYKFFFKNYMREWNRVKEQEKCYNPCEK